MQWGYKYRRCSAFKSSVAEERGGPRERELVPLKAEQRWKERGHAGSSLSHGVLTGRIWASVEREYGDESKMAFVGREASLLLSSFEPVCWSVCQQHNSKYTDGL